MVYPKKRTLLYFELATTAAKKDTIIFNSLTKKEYDALFYEALNSLPGHHKAIIEKTFIQKNKIWWQSIYKKSSYYNHRKIALESFTKTFKKLLCTKSSR